MTREEGGRHTPFFNGYRPQFLLQDDGRNGSNRASAGSRDGNARGQRKHESKADNAYSDRRRVKVCHQEGGRTVGAGAVTQVIK